MNTVTTAPKQSSSAGTDRLIYLLADIVGTPIYLINGRYRGHLAKDVKLAGLWKLGSDVTVCVDENTPALLTAFMRVRKNLWAYVVVTEAGKWLLFFDNDRAKIRVGAEAEFGNGNGLATLKKLKTAIVAAMTVTNGRWDHADPKDLLSDL